MFPSTKNQKPPTRINFLQPTLENEKVIMQPLQKSDFEWLYEVASDPLIWEMHPNKNRYEREVFRNFFEGAMMSGGAFLIIDKESGEVAGSTRFTVGTKMKARFSLAILLRQEILGFENESAGEEDE